MKRVGIVGWRGMVGSVLMERMLAERDFDLIDEPVNIGHQICFDTTDMGGYHGAEQQPSEAGCWIGGQHEIAEC
jgi:aspartate-semialdehyde dehydrogenase